MSCLPRDHDPYTRMNFVHLNEFDKELVDFNLAGIESQETSGLRVGGSEEIQAEDINGVQRKESDNLYNDSHSNDRRRLRVLPQEVATRQDITASSGTTETEPSSTSAAPGFPVQADGSIALNESRPIQDSLLVEHRETRLSPVDCETMVNNMANELGHTLISQRGPDVLRDQSPPNNPSTPITAAEKTESPNLQLLRCSSKEGAEPRESSPATTEAHSIQSHATDPTATHDGHSGVRSGGNEAYLTCQLGEDEALSSPVLSVLQERKRAGSRPGGEDSPRDRSCSVSVVVPEPQSYGPGIKRSTRAGRTRYTGKRESRAKSPCDVDSDDPDDHDYTDGNESGVGDIAALPRPAKRQKRTATMKIQPAQALCESPHPVFSPPAQLEDTFANPLSATSLQDMETVPIRGFLTRQTFLSRVIYSCTFEEDKQPSCPHRPTKAPAYGENLHQTGRTTQLSSKKPSAHATRFLPDEDELLVELKERHCLPWSRIAKHFPGRTKNSLQVRYCTRLKDRGTGSVGRDRSGKIKYAAAAAHQEACGRHPRSRTAGSKSVDADLTSRQRCGPPRARRAVNRYSPA
ncbi:hypothetical protein CBS147326_2833 [Penicillium roqueforti]|nr:hypothetical protein CBS147326_2833 [Penicillium roqueforti]